MVGVALGATALWGVFAVEKLETTARGVAVSILASAIIFIAANKLFDLAPDRWSLFTTLVGAAGTFVVYALLWGNRAIDDPVLRTVIATLVGALAGYLLGTVHQRWARLGIGIGAGGALGALAASGMRRVILVFELESGTFELWPVLPYIDYGVLVGATLVGAVIGLLLWQARGRRNPPVRPMLFGATVGFLFAGWLLPSLGYGNQDGRADRLHRGGGGRRGPDRSQTHPRPQRSGAASKRPPVRTFSWSRRWDSSPPPSSSRPCEPCSSPSMDTRGQEYVGFVNYQGRFLKPQHLQRRRMGRDLHQQALPGGHRPGAHRDDRF